MTDPMLVLLCALNIAFNFLIEPAFLWFFAYVARVPFLNAYSVLVLALLPVRLLWLFAGPSVHFDDGVLDGTYQYLLLLENLHFSLRHMVAGAMILALSHQNVVAGLIDRFHYQPISTARLRLAAGLFFGLFLLFFVVTASWSFGLINWILSPRTGYQMHRTGAGAFYALSVSFLAVSYVLALLSLSVRWHIIAAWLFFLPFVFMLGSKGYLILYTVTAFAFMLIYGFKIQIRTVAAVGVVMAAAVLLNFGSADLVDIFFYFDYYSNSAYFIRAYHNGIADLFYGQISATEIISAVPRLLWADKPFVYGPTLLNEMFYPGLAEAGHTPAFGGPILAYADFGVPGVVLGGLTDWGYLGHVLMAFLLLTSLRERGAGYVRSHHFHVFLAIMLLAPGYLNFFAFPLNLGLMGFVACGIFACNLLPRLRLVRFA